MMNGAKQTELIKKMREANKNMKFLTPPDKLRKMFVMLDGVRIPVVEVNKFLDEIE